MPDASALKGTYSYQLNIPDPTSQANPPLVIMGTFTADGAGNLISNDMDHQQDNRAGTYTVNPDGSGTILMRFHATLGVRIGPWFDFVPSAGFSELWLNSNPSGQSILGQAKKQ